MESKKFWDLIPEEIREDLKKEVMSEHIKSLSTAEQFALLSDEERTAIKAEYRKQLADSQSIENFKKEAQNLRNQCRV